MGEESAVLLNISEMIDLAIGTPEVGIVDFNMLQTVLHCLAQQLRVLGKNVELRGSVVTLPIGRENVQTIAISEYIVETDETPEEKKKTETSSQPPSGDKETMLVVERIKKADSPNKDSPLRAHSPEVQGAPGTHRATEHSAPAKHRTVAPRAVTSTEKLSLVTVSKFNLLENTVADLRNRVYGSLPKNEDILEEVRSQTNMKAITDMWTSLNVSSRLEAAESGIAKLSSLVQDLITESADPEGGLKRPSRIAALVSAAAAVGQTVGEAAAAGHAGGGYAVGGAGAGGPAGAGPAGAGHAGAGPAGAGFAGAGPAGAGFAGAGPAGAGFAGAGPAGTGFAGAGPAGAGPAGGGPAGGGLGTGGQIAGGPAGGRFTDGTTMALPPPFLTPGSDPNAPVTGSDLGYIMACVERIKGELDHLSNTFYTAMQDMNVDVGSRPPQQPLGLPVLMQTPADASNTSVESGSIRSWHLWEADHHRADYPRKVSTLTIGLADRVNQLEKKLKECCDCVGKNEGVVQDHINSFQDQLEDMHKQVACVSQDFASGKLSPDLIKDLQGLMQLFQTVQEMQEQLKQVHETALQLAAEKEDRQQHMNALLEQIELLKTIKLDREDMIEAMAEKADLRMLARKVSHDQFEIACDDLSRGLEHALGKLNMQESLWQQALDDIQREIETKLDKMELSPVKEFFNNKLKQLQENLKQMAALRREAEAAGTKRRLLRDVNCISCDANAVMNMEAVAALPGSKPLPATLSMKPYLSYELDAIRKAQASNMQQRNMHDWETIDKQMTQSKPPQKVRSETDKHLCNRYCGGSHTVTTPAQRVTRVGHFVKQWGPEVLPLSSGLAAGDDGRMYKVSTVENANVGPGGAVDSACTPKLTPKKSDAKPPQKPIIISPECRCLEEDHPARE